MARKDEVEEEVGEDVEWLVDDNGVEYFIEADGTRYELADDGYAYAAEAPPEPAPKPPAPKPAAKTKSAATVKPKTSATSMASKVAMAKAAAAKTAGSAAAKAETARAATKTAATQAAAKAAASKAPASPPATTSPRTPPAAPSDGPKDVLLKIDSITSGYGSLPVLHGVSTEIRVGETAVLLGLNGAGKTTTALNICGALPTWGGTITFDGQDITDWNIKQCVSAGIIMCPEGRRVFPDLSVAKNLQIGSWMKRKDKDWIVSQQDAVFNYFPRLRQRTAQLAGSLSGGEQQMLAMGRALMAQPRLLIVDEASMGLAPVIVKDVFNIIADINKDGVTVLLIEQNVGALEVAQLGLVMEQGRMVKELRGARLLDRSEVTDVLMG